jgi:hypothetical protein
MRVLLLVRNPESASTMAVEHTNSSALDKCYEKGEPEQ